jgi:hypothetical protein
MQDAPDIVVYMTRLFGSAEKKPLHVYIFSHQATEDLYDRMFLCLQRFPEVELYLLDSLPGLSGVPGFSWTCALARSYGFTNLHAIPFSDNDMVNTYTESKAVIRFFQEHDIHLYHICSPAFHLPRAFHSMVSVHNQTPRSWAQIYVIPGTISAWDHNITHSQGTLKDTTSRMITHEYNRTMAYMTKGDLVPLRLCLEYMDKYW